jgi:hypothetical protein
MAGAAKKAQVRARTKLNMNITSSNSWPAAV